MQDQNRILQRELAHVYWIGGSPCAGKSSLADSLAEKYGLYLYRADKAFFRHEKIVTSKEQPIFHRVIHYSSEELWMRPVVRQVAEEIALYREEFPLILEELLALPRSTPVLAEGAALLPECVTPLLSVPQHAIWIIPTAEFQLYHYERRAWAHDVVSSCKDPTQAFQNWMQRDIQFARFVEEEALRRKMRVLVVDGASSIAENRAIVERHCQFG